MNIPLYDLHIHLGGAIPIEIIRGFLAEDNHPLAEADLHRMMTYIDDNGPYEFGKFLKKFDVMNVIRWTEKRIEQATIAAIDVIASQGIEHAEIRFTIDKYVSNLGMSEREATIMVSSYLLEAAGRFGISISPLLSVKYESNREQQRTIMKLINDPQVHVLVDGIDLVGNEMNFDASFYAPMFREWRDSGKGLIAHVGESQTAQNVIMAIEELHVDRVSHGIKATSDERAMALAKERKIPFDIALTSNLRTGVVNDLRDHPIKTLIEYGCHVTIGTDDPVILDTTIQHEYEIARNIVGLSNDQINQIKLNAIEYAL